MPVSRIDIHNRRHRLELLLNKIKVQDIISKDNKKILLEYYDYLFSENLSISRIEKVLQTLYTIAKQVKKPFNKMKYEDVIKLVSWINQNDNWGDWTKADFKKIFKKFYWKYLKKMEEYPLEARRIKTTFTKNNHIVPEQLLTVEEITKIAGVTEKIRDRALIYVLYESGTRIGELLNMRIGDCHFDKFGAMLDVTGKTGSRRVRIITSKQVLLDWINHHPLKESDSPLWINNQKKPLKYAACVRILRKLFKLSGVRKKYNPHLFRHSRATHLAKLKLNEAMLKKFFGWTDRSGMAAYYVHLAESDVDDALLGLHGIEIKKEGKKLEKIFRVIVCPSCGKEHTPDVKICPCGMIFDRTLTKKRIAGDKILDQMLESPDFTMAFERRLKEMGYKKGG